MYARRHRHHWQSEAVAGLPCRATVKSSATLSNGTDGGVVRFALGGPGSHISSPLQSAAISMFSHMAFTMPIRIYGYH